MYWLELFRSRRGIRDGCTGRAGRLHESNVVHLRSRRYRCYSERIQEDGLGVELGVVIGNPAKYVKEADVLSHVAAYCVINDLSERAFQLEGTGQWVKGKSADTFGPIGPWLVTPDEVPDPQNLEMWLEVDGHRYQNGSTKTIAFGVAYLISYISRFMSLRTGDIISTGTPPGVGFGLKPPVYLRPGNRIHLGITGLGQQNQQVVSD